MTVYIVIDLTESVKDCVLGVFNTLYKAESCIDSYINMRCVKTSRYDYTISIEELN